MITNELIAYIHQELAAGVTIDEIKERLRASGWEEDDIEQAITMTAQSKTKEYNTSSPSFLQRTFNDFNTNLVQTLNAFRENIKTCVIIQGLQGIIFIIFFLNDFQLSKIIDLSRTSIYIDLVIVLLLKILPYIVFVTSHLALLYAISEQTHPLGILGYFQKAIKSLWKFWLLSFLIQLYAGWRTIVLVLASFILSTLLGLLVPIARSYVIFIYYGSVISGVIITIYFNILYSPAIYVFVSEGVGIKESLKQSEYYISGHVVRILLHLIMLSVAFFPLGIIPIVGIYLDIFIGIPFANIYLYKLYKNIRLLRNDYYV